jgi:hypothetical protein
VGTIFEDRKIPLVKWFMAIWMLTSHHKHSIGTRNFSYSQTVWFILHPLRGASQTKLFYNPLSGTGVCQRCCPPISCGVSDFRGAGFDEATQIGIQTFGMINVADGARLAEESETPEFFDVMVSVSPDERLRSKTELKPQTTARSPHDRQASNTRFDNSSFFDPKSQRRCFDGAFLGQFIMGKLSIYSPQ